MKIYKVIFLTFTYSIDFPVLFLFFGVLIDIISTSLFIGLNVGTEANPILRELISVSPWFIPVYLLLTNAVFVPFLSVILRKTLSYTLGLVSLLFGLNNLSLVLFNYAFLVDALGFNIMVLLFVLVGLAFFIYFLKTEKPDKKRTISFCFRLIVAVGFLGLIQFLFLVITWLVV